MWTRPGKQAWLTPGDTRAHQPVQPVQKQLTCPSDRRSRHYRLRSEAQSSSIAKNSHLFHTRASTSVSSIIETCALCSKLAVPTVLPPFAKHGFNSEAEKRAHGTEIRGASAQLRGGLTGHTISQPIRMVLTAVVDEAIRAMPRYYRAAYAGGRTHEDLALFSHAVP